MSGAHAELLDLLGLIDPLEASEAELETLENAPMVPRRKKAKCVRRANDPPRDELGRFTRLKKKGTNASGSR